MLWATIETYAVSTAAHSWQSSKLRVWTEHDDYRLGFSSWQQHPAHESFILTIQPAIYSSAIRLVPSQARSTKHQTSAAAALSAEESCEQA
jgi:hypothetical protein